MNRTAKKKSCLTKIKNYLESLGAEFLNESDASNSLYLSINGKKIRVSDHQSPIPNMNQKNRINITITSNEPYMYFVGVNGGILGYPTMKDLKTFLKSWCEYDTCLTEGIMSCHYAMEVGKSKHLQEVESEIQNKHFELGKAQRAVDEARKKEASLNDMLKKKMQSLRKWMIDTGVCNGEDEISRFTDGQMMRLLSYVDSFSKQNAALDKKKAEDAAKKKAAAGDAGKEEAE